MIGVSVPLSCSDFKEAHRSCTVQNQKRHAAHTSLGFSFISTHKMTSSYIYLDVEIHWDGPGSHQFFHEVTSPVSVLGMDRCIHTGKKHIFMTEGITAPHHTFLPIQEPICIKKPSPHSDSIPALRQTLLCKLTPKTGCTGSPLQNGLGQADIQLH